MSCSRVSIPLTVVLAATLFCGALKAEALGDDLVPLEKLIKEQQFEASYPFVTCAAWYKSTAEHAGVVTLPKGVVENFQKTIRTDALAAAKIRAAKRGGSPKDYVDQVTADVVAIATIYHARMDKNYALSGQALVSDPLMTSDGTACKALNEGFAEK
jgi:hypothetical protein